jgi:hypothetical protein
MQEGTGGYQSDGELTSDHIVYLVADVHKVGTRTHVETSGNTYALCMPLLTSQHELVGGLLFQVADAHAKYAAFMSLPSFSLSKQPKACPWTA